VYVIRGGEIVMESSAADLSSTDDMFRAYMG
jgi:hypothetical protein